MPDEILSFLMFRLKENKMLFSRRLFQTAAAAIVALSWSTASAAAETANTRHGNPGSHDAGHANGGLPFGVTVYGNFKHMQHTGDFDSKVTLGDALSGKDVYAVGALSRRRGEITVIAGKPYISLGNATSSRLLVDGANNEGAALLVTADAIEWKKLSVPNDMSQAEFETFVVDSAKNGGLDISKPFPFMLNGDISNYKMHVLRALGPNQPIAEHGAAGGQYNAKGELIQGRLMGFYSGAKLSGVISHPGELFHVHIVDSTESISAHMDNYGVVKRSTLSIPAMPVK